jgi:peptidoglycan/LPS O-acetylase OafA/YrhL
MTRAFSIYLDLLRFLAACLVVVYHSNSRMIVESILPFSSYGHSAVIIFFVLSGFVIAYATDTKEHDARAYWSSRLSRVWSLAVPAVLLAPLLDLIGKSLAPELYAGNTTDGYVLLRILTSLAFLNEVWFISIQSFSNIAYWSLNYEVWYYAAFAIYAFGNKRWRWMLIGLLLLVLGPKIALLAPIWVLGVVIYRWNAAKRINETTGWLLAVSSCVLLIAFEHYDVTSGLFDWLKSQIGSDLHRNLTFSRWFLSDYLLAGIVFMNFVGMRRVAFRVAGLFHALEKPIRLLAGFTFSIYILHQPLIYFFTALINLPTSGYQRYAAVMTCVAISIWLIGSVTEMRRFAMRRWLLLVSRPKGIQPKAAP